MNDFFDEYLHEFFEEIRPEFEYVWADLEPHKKLAAALGMAVSALALLIFERLAKAGADGEEETGHIRTRRGWRHRGWHLGGHAAHFGGHRGWQRWHS